MPATPLDLGGDVLNRAEALRDHALAVTDVSLRDDLLRASLAFGVAAYDTYLHAALSKSKLRTMPPALEKYVRVSIGDLARLARSTVEDRTANTRPTTRVRKVLQAQILTMTFQSGEQVERAISMLGIKSGLKHVGLALTQPLDTAAIKARLDKLSHRRNTIVHEGDLLRLVRPQRPNHRKITRKGVNDDLAWIREFLMALDLVVS